MVGIEDSIAYPISWVDPQPRIFLPIEGLEFGFSISHDTGDYILIPDYFFAPRSLPPQFSISDRQAILPPAKLPRP
ncbi:hypothetical protein IQ235_00490 [Oscillatoriales cyanobacterium LEGE 11467]|uniref:Uncharacterized protein n=1 Tax=Zarconia navalis LEGE 11467 TaxID=1828826 RepID=A0A928VTY7_9CYAN|nr:hypothetical protein [Zarconia navalis]MBE9039273.1 hypothetical protein [Zarconia navalis LEGE 11467]